MTGHYVRVNEAAALLGVSPATIRWYTLQGWLPAYRIGRGRVEHRRFRYEDIRRVGFRTGKFLPEEPEWDRTVPISLDMASRYLALSPRYLVESGWASPGSFFTWDELTALERRVYPETGEIAPDAPPPGEEGKPDMMHPMSEDGHHRRGPHRMRPPMGWFAGGPGGWPAAEPPENASLLALRRMKRHLETRKADLEDEIAELERRIASHPDNPDRS